MRKRSQETEEWKDGFLFVGNHIALDLLNTRPVPDGTTPVELLADAGALQRWLTAASLLVSEKGKGLVQGWRDSAEAEIFLTELRTFRERLRAAVIRHEAGKAVPADFLSDLNRLLQDHPIRVRLSYQDGVLRREVGFEPTTPGLVWPPIVAAAADLLSQAEPSRVRQCEACVVHFRDVSKKNSRRWCSMNLCGNKIKVAAYRRRRGDMAAD